MAKNTEIAERIEGIEAEFDVEIEITGGGRGWTAKVDGLFEAKAESKGLALSLLENALTDDRDSGDAGEAGDEAGDEEIEGCNDECQSSVSLFCQCACEGMNHGIAGAGLATSGQVVKIGEKLCKCGCGETTKRTFVPGHDARHHALVALRAYAMANGIEDLDEARKSKVAAQRKAARERRAEKRAKQAKVDAKAAKAAEALAKSLQPKTPKSRKNDDLPF